MTPTQDGGFRAVADFLMQDRQGNEGLRPDDRALATIGCLLAVGPDSPELDAALRTAMADGVAPWTIDAVLVHAIGYLGVVVVRRAHRRWALLREALALPEESKALPPIATDRQQRVDQGSALYDRFDPGRQAQQAEKFAVLSPDYYPRAMELSGLVLADPALALRERQIVTVAILSCMGGQPDQLRFHMGVALRNGVAQEVLAAVLVIVQACAGMPRANSAAALALEVLQP